ncbi:MAG: hypothetical protein GX174_10235 [Lentisphaerae bacterium]|jgi:hypothetical protein|nr:hypothetical protein [Lentisphaerota bacterium]
MMKHSFYCKWAAALLLAAAAVSGCRMIQIAADVPGQAVRAVTPGARVEEGPDPVEIQALVMRFGDDFVSRLTTGIDSLQVHGAPMPTGERLRSKIAVGSSVCAIATGPNIQANLLDMTAFVMETRMSLQTARHAERFGASALPLVETCLNAETGLWRVCERILKPAQQADLREVIEVWHRQNSTGEWPPGVRTIGLAIEMVRAKRQNSDRGVNLLGALLLDPLAELDPTRREIAEIRLFAERGLFVGRHMPNLLRWQVELVTQTTLEQPVVQVWTTNVTHLTQTASHIGETVTHVAEAASRLAATAEQLPGQLTAEREALVKTLREEQEKTLTPLVEGVRETLLAGSGLATNTATMLTTFDSVMARMGVDGSKDDAAPVPEKEKEERTPFRIQDYSEAAERLEASALRLTELLQTFDQTLGANSREALAAQLDPLVQRTRTETQALVDHLFRRALQLTGALLVAALVYRLVAARLSRPGTAAR